MKVLMIGLGGIGQRHARNLRAILGDSVEFIAYRFRRQTHVITPALGADHTRNVEDEYAIRVFPTLEAALGEKPDIAFVCNPSNLHVPAALDCLRAGCDVFVEKPLTDSMRGTDELLRVAEERERIVMVGYQMRFHPCLQRIREIVLSGALGQLLSVRATIGEYLPGWHPYEDYRQMYASRADLGGGVVLSQIHEFDYLYSLFGLPSRIYALGGHWSELEVDAEDTASILMECSINGRPLPVHLHQDFLQSPPSRQCEIIGDRARAVMDLHALTVTVFARGQAAPVVDSFHGFERNQLFLDQTRHFLECVETRRRPVVDLCEGLQSLRMALAAKQSIVTQQPIDPASLRDALEKVQG